MDNPYVAQILNREEGFCSYAYQDSKGFWTIGYGTLIDRRNGGGITEPEGALLRDNRIALRVDSLNHMLPWLATLDPVRQAVLISMAYQMGVGGLMQFVRTLEAIREGDWDLAANRMLQSLWAQQTPERAARMAQAIRTGLLD